MVPMVPDFDANHIGTILFAVFVSPLMGLATMGIFAACLRMGLPAWPLTTLLGGAVAFGMGTLSLVWTSPIAGRGASTAQLIEWTCICVAAGLAAQAGVILYLRRRNSAAEVGEKTAGRGSGWTSPADGDRGGGS